MFKRLLCVMLSLALLLSAAFALAEADTAETPAPAEETPAPAEVTPAPADAADAVSEEPVLLVTINGEPIMSDNSELQYWISYYLYQLSSYGYDLTDPELLNTVNQYALNTTLRVVMIKQKAAELGLDKFTEEETAELREKAKADWEELVLSYEADAGITADSTEDEKAAARADALAVLEADGYEEEAYIQDYVDSELNNMLITRLRDHLSADASVTDEEVQAYFDQMVAQDEQNYGQSIDYYEYMTYYVQPSYFIPAGYRGITHILLEVDDQLLANWIDLSARYEEQQAAAGDEAVPAAGGEAADAEAADAEAAAEPTAEPVTLEMVEAAKQAVLDSVQPKVDEIKAKLAAGASFDDLILEYGIDPGMKDAATRAEGYAVHKDSIIWDPAFTAAAMGLEKIGDVSEPVVGQNGVHILYYLRDIPSGPVELTDEMKNEIRASLLEEKKDNLLYGALDQWLASSEIVYTEAGELWKIQEATEEAAEETAAEAAEEKAVEAVEETAAEETGEKAVEAAEEAVEEVAAPAP